MAVYRKVFERAIYSMTHWVHDIGTAEEGKILRISLDYSAYVRIMDQTNYKEYKTSKTYSANIKLVTSSPYIVRLPYTAHWFVVVDLGGQKGKVKSSVLIHDADKKIPVGERIDKLPEWDSRTTIENNQFTKDELENAHSCCQLWNRYLDIIDCDKATVRMHGFNNKQDYIDKWEKACLPYFQPDGQRSYAKALMLVKNAFKSEVKPFRWMHQLPDGTQMMTEATLKRVLYQGEQVIAWYTKDISDIASMENEIEKLKSQADKIYYDPLTGIYNRRYLDENLERIIKSLSDSNKKLSVMMIDIDCFKQYNDTYGHNEGDKCLKIVAEVLKKSIHRSDDFVVRYGGEEFTMALPEVDENGACMVAERLLENMRNCNIPHIKNAAADCVTFSVGIATSCVLKTQIGENYINHADEMLYAAKRNGRDRYMHISF